LKGRGKERERERGYGRRKGLGWEGYVYEFCFNWNEGF
jgi:hypothetical protein